MKMKSTVLTREQRNTLTLAALHPGGMFLSNSDIGQRLGVSSNRVKTLIHQACVKLGAHNRMEAIIFAMRWGEIHSAEAFSLDELAEISSTLGTDMLRWIAYLVRKEQMLGYFLDNGEQIMHINRRKDGIFTNSERDVLALAGRGLTNTEIAGRLYISAGSVRIFLERAYIKLGAHKRADATLLALKQGEINIYEIHPLHEMVLGLAQLGAESIEKIAQMLD